MRRLWEVAKVVTTPFWKNGRMTLTLPKWGLGSPFRLSNLQSSISRVKTPHIEAFFTLLESFRWELQVCLRLHPNWRSKKRVMRPQKSQESELLEFWDSHLGVLGQTPFGCGPRGELWSILYGGRWWLPPSPGCGESCESKLAVACPNTKGTLESELTNLWLGECKFEWVFEKLVTPPTPIPKLQHAPLPLLVLKIKSVPRTPNNFAV
jgi:hypothetical protein